MTEMIFVIEVYADAGAEVKHEIEEATGSSVLDITRENDTGALPTVILILQAVSPIIAAAAPLIVEIIRNRKPKRIKFGDFEIENPTPEQWDQLWRKYKTDKEE